MSFFVSEEAKETILDISNNALKVLLLSSSISYNYKVLNSVNAKLANPRLNESKNAMKNDALVTLSFYTIDIANDS